MRYQYKCQRMVRPGNEAVESNWRRKKRCSICGSRPVKNINIAKKISPSGNWTRVTRVTGRYTNHYTNEDRYDRTPCHLTHTICTPPLTTPQHTTGNKYMLPLFCCVSGCHHTSWPIHIILPVAIFTVIDICVTETKAHFIPLSSYQATPAVLSRWQYSCSLLVT